MRRNLGFYQPRKDQCQKCTAFKNLGDAATEDDVQQNNDHVQRAKEASQAAYSSDKEVSIHSQGEVVVATFDLQSVLPIPCTEASPMFYKRKLRAYNLTVFELASKQGFCYVWLQTEGKRGSSEIGTCLLKWLTSLPPTTKRVVLWSDNCGGQNRNQFVLTALVWAVSKLPIESITLRFLETGHTMMEVDAMHARIEAEKKNVDIYLLHDWLNIMRAAKKTGQPYKVEELLFQEFKDLRGLNTEIIHNVKKAVTGDDLSWKKA